VLAVKDGIATVDGLLEVGVGELVQFETIVFKRNLYGLVLNLNLQDVSIVLLGPEASLIEGTACLKTGTLFGVRVGWHALGRVLDARGMFCDEKKSNFFGLAKYSFVERKAPGIKYREPVSEPVLTGLKVIDALIPIGRGQRELIIGDRQTGKTTIAIDTILNQFSFFEIYPEKVNISKIKRTEDSNKNICIYVAIGQKRSTVAKIFNLLEEHAALRYTIILAATASESAAMQYIIPYSACTFGEFFARLGLSTIIVYDDLSKHANAYRQISLLLRRPPGREAYPGDIFYLHSRLLERSFKLARVYGGGSITALPIIETQAGDVSAYIPTNVISITDGQIFLETEIFYKGIRPAVNPGLSVSRVGSAAQKKVMKKVAGSLKLELAQYREISGFSKFASSLDDSTRKLLRRGELLSELLKQPPHVPLFLETQIVQMFPVLRGLVDKVLVSQILAFSKAFFSFASKLFFSYKRFILNDSPFTFHILSKAVLLFLTITKLR
jgi:F-type H+-transporting ATPase subunit alpha